jgi:flagellar hook-associated protein 1 FlgK
MATAGDGTISFTLDGNPVTPLSGALVGRGQALVKLADTRSQLDAIADGIIATVNTAQASGAALDGSPGAAMLSGSGAAGIALAFEQGALIATAPAGSGPGSRDLGNLAALRNALAGNDAAGTMDALLFDVSATVRGRTITRNTLEVIADNARIALAAQAGVDLDQEAINLVRFQQAFQASGRVMQVASDLFDTLLGIR